VADHLIRGACAEWIARRHLERRGLTHVASNYRCLYGEIDLVMTERDLLVIVEVRYRRSARPVRPEDSVTPAKARRIARAARHFLLTRPSWRESAVRFDVIGLHGPLARPEMNWIRGAFTIDDL
jgi:putative endonuclease